MSEGFLVFAVSEATYEARLRALEGLRDSSKAHKGSETKTRELLEGTEDHTPMRGYAFQANQRFTKSKLNKINLVESPNLLLYRDRYKQ